MATVVSKDGTRIAFDREGSGPPLILVDGAMCYRASGPMPAIARLLTPRWMRNATRELAGVLPNARYETLPGQTHMVQAKVLAPVLVKFFEHGA